METQTNKITETTHPKEGYLPRKMFNWPKNIEAAKALAEKYDLLAAEGVCTLENLSAKTGFGHPKTCSLCNLVREPHKFLPCQKCIHHNTNDNRNAPCTGHYTYKSLECRAFTPDDLRERSKYLRKLIAKFE